MKKVLVFIRLFASECRSLWPQKVIYDETNLDRSAYSGMRGYESGCFQ